MNKQTNDIDDTNNNEFLIMIFNKHKLKKWNNNKKNKH